MFNFFKWIVYDRVNSCFKSSVVYDKENKRRNYIYNHIYIYASITLIIVQIIYGSKHTRKPMWQYQRS